MAHLGSLGVCLAPISIAAGADPSILIATPFVSLTQATPAILTTIRKNRCDKSTFEERHAQIHDRLLILLAVSGETFAQSAPSPEVLRICADR